MDADVSGSDTTCDVTTCATNERVSNNAYVACAAGTTNEAGDDASGSDTTCDVTLCALNERVSKPQRLVNELVDGLDRDQLDLRRVRLCADVLVRWSVPNQKMYILMIRSAFKVRIHL